MNTVTTASEALARYTEYLREGRLVQSTWHSTASDGRALACGLGVLGDEVSSPQDCPATIMPRWLAQMVPWFFDKQSFENATAWGAAFYAELARLGGNVPFSVFYDWHHSVVGPLAIEQAKTRKSDVNAHSTLAQMQLDALNGKKISPEKWLPVLKAAFRDINKFCYEADAVAAAYAYADAYADDAAAAAYANAYAAAAADAYAYAAAYVYADANAYADATKYHEAIHRLAMGMVECLKRVPAGNLWPCGHARTPENTQKIGKAGVRCRKCRRAIALRSRHKRKAPL